MMALSSICTTSTLWLFQLKSSELTRRHVRIRLNATLCVDRSSLPYHNWSCRLYQANGTSEDFHMYEANDIRIQHRKDPQVNSCRRMIWLRRVGMFFDYKSLIQRILIALDCLMFFHLQMLCRLSILLSQSQSMLPNRILINANIALVWFAWPRSEKHRQWWRLLRMNTSTLCMM